MTVRITPIKDTPQVQNSIGAVDTIVSVADEVVEGLGDLITPTAQGDDYAEAAIQGEAGSDLLLLLIFILLNLIFLVFVKHFQSIGIKFHRKRE